MLAIVIPYYKLTFFEDTLQSLANQTDKRFKVYIGDDASPENPTDLLKKINGVFEFTYHRFDVNLGSISLTQQWERCIELTHNEEWIMVLGDDDRMQNNAVEEFYQLLQQYKTDEIDLVRFNLKGIDHRGNIKTEDYRLENLEQSQDLLDKMLSCNHLITASEFVFSRNIYNLKKGFVDYPLAWFSDYATWLTFSRSYGIYNINTASVFWRLSSLNISSQKKDSRTISLKVKSLFLFSNFIKKEFIVSEKKINQFTLKHFKNLTSELTYKEYLMIIVNSLTLENKMFLRMMMKFLIQKVKK